MLFCLVFTSLIHVDRLSGGKYFWRSSAGKRNAMSVSGCLRRQLFPAASGWCGSHRAHNHVHSVCVSGWKPLAQSQSSPSRVVLASWTNIGLVPIDSITMESTLDNRLATRHGCVSGECQTCLKLFGGFPAPHTDALCVRGATERGPVCPTQGCRSGRFVLTARSVPARYVSGFQSSCDSLTTVTAMGS